MNILILTSKFGMGHYSAALTIAKEISKSGKGDKIITADIYEHAFPNCTNAVYKAYSAFIERGWKIYNLAYRKVTESEKDGSEKKLSSGGYFDRAIEKKTRQLIEESRADLVIVTYSQCARIISKIKAETGSKIPLVTCITDVSSHDVWTNEYTDVYLVATAETKEDLAKRGIDRSRILVSGIPVREDFKAGGWIYKSMKKELLIMGGGLGLLPKDLKFYEKLNELQNVHMTVITGENKKMYAKLKGRYANVTVVQFTNQVHEYMRKADAIITKPGGLTVFEAIHSQVPLIVFTPFLEQEMRNGQFIAENEFGLLLDKKPRDGVEDIRQLLDDEVRLAKYKRNMGYMKSRLKEEAVLNTVEYYRNQLCGKMAEGF